MNDHLINGRNADDHASKWKGLTWVVAGCLLGVAFAVGLSPLAHAIPWSWEKKLGKALEWDVTEQACRFNPRAQVLLQQLVKRLYPVQPEDGDFSIEVQIVRNPVVNAYAALGGQITINSGLLKQAQSPEEVAGVLAHEIGHVHHRHIMQGVLTHLFTAQGINMIFGAQSSAATWTNYFMTMDFSRSQEAEADEDGLIRLQKAHVDNQGFKRFFERMAETEPSSAFLSDHPSSRSRMEMVDQFTNQDVTPVMAPADWKILKNDCGGL